MNPDEPMTLKQAQEMSLRRAREAKNLNVGAAGYYTERARRAMVLSQEEAQRTGHVGVNSGHLLLGLLSEGESKAAKALIFSGITLSKARAAMQAYLPSLGAAYTSAPVMSPQAMRIFEIAAAEATKRGESAIGTEHIFIGIWKEGTGAGYNVLKHLGFEKIMQQLLASMPRELSP